MLSGIERLSWSISGAPSFCVLIVSVALATGIVNTSPTQDFGQGLPLLFGKFRQGLC